MATKNAFAGLEVEEPELNNDDNNSSSKSSKNKKKNDKKKEKKKEKKLKDRAEKARLLMMESEPGFIDTLTPEMKTALEQLKAKHSAGYPELTDHDFLRYLRAKNFNVSEASEILVSAEQWRKQYKPMNVPLTDFAFTLDYNLITHLAGRDRKGRPTCITRVRYHNKKDSIVALAISLYFMERGIKECMIPGKIESFTYIFDCTGFSLFQADNNFTFTFLRCLKEVYPERVGSILIMNAPWIFSAFWNIVKRWVDPRTAEKIVFLGGDYKEKLKLFLEPSQIPVDMGGSLKYDPKAWIRQELQKLGIEVPLNKPIERPAQFSEVIQAIMKGTATTAEANTEIELQPEGEPSSHPDTFVDDEDED